MKQAAAMGLVLAATAAVYWPSTHAGFVGDDFMILHRLRELHAAGDALRFFRGEFFDFYRPLAFLSHAFDWWLGGADARPFHATNLLLHLANIVLVALIARRLVPGAALPVLAALLFALHASNHEAVVWISARFDLLATFWSLAAFWWLIEGGPAAPWGSGVLFFLAALSKESTVAMPIAATGWAVIGLRAGRARTIAVLLPWLAALGAYAVLRQLAGGVPATGGRLPKLLALAAVLGVLVLVAGSRWLKLREALRHRRATFAFASAVAIALLAAGAAFSGGMIGTLAREKLAVAGFGVFYLLSPLVDLTLTPYFLDPGTSVYWAGGAVALALAAAIIVALWPILVETDAAWVILLLLAATMLPISALTEGKRYLYLPSAAAALLMAVVIRELRPSARRAVVAIAAAAIALSVWQVSRKVQDWVWAGRMTADGAALVNAALGPSCQGQIVFLTEPVSVRSVYTQFYYETFEPNGGCRPVVFQVLMRVVRVDTKVDVRWDGPARIVMTTPEYRGNFVLSRDLRHFDVMLRAQTDARVDTPLGEVRAENDAGAERVTLTLGRDVDRGSIRFFWFSEGRMSALGQP